MYLCTSQGFADQIEILNCKLYLYLVLMGNLQILYHIRDNMQMYGWFGERAPTVRVQSSRSWTLIKESASTMANCSILGWCETLCSPIEVRSYSWPWNVANCPDFLDGGQVWWLPGCQPYLVEWLWGSEKSAQIYWKMQLCRPTLQLTN